MAKDTLIEMVETDLSAKEVRILKACSDKEPDEFSDKEMQEFSEVAEKAKSALLANLATLHISKLIELLTSGCMFVPGIRKVIGNNPHKLGCFGYVVKGKFTGREIDKLFALSEAYSEYTDGEVDSFSEADEQTLEELAQKARGILIAKIEPCDAVKLFTEPENVCK